jgi:hypothetical protein
MAPGCAVRRQLWSDRSLRVLPRSCIFKAFVFTMGEAEAHIGGEKESRWTCDAMMLGGDSAWRAKSQEASSGPEVAPA